VREPPALTGVASREAVRATRHFIHPRLRRSVLSEVGQGLYSVTSLAANFAFWGFSEVRNI
jgi:hypothetical protein